VLTNWEPRTRFSKSRKVVFPSKTLLLPSTPFLPPPLSNKLNSLLLSISVPRCNQFRCNIHIDTHKQRHPPSSCAQSTPPSPAGTRDHVAVMYVYKRGMYLHFILPDTGSSVLQTDARSAYNLTRSRLESRVCVMASTPNMSMQQQSRKRLSLVSTKVLRLSNLTIL
jgi:hypothetical protein